MDSPDANLINTDLRNANLQQASLQSANLKKANLQYVLVSDQQLATAGSLKGAIMMDGTKHD